MDYRNTENQSLSAATSYNQDAIDRESSAHAAGPLMTGPMGMGPVVTGPLVPNVPTPLPFQVPINPSTYPAYYQVPMAVPYPVRYVEGRGYVPEWEQARFFPGPFYPRPFFYPPVPPPFFFPPFFI